MLSKSFILGLLGPVLGLLLANQDVINGWVLAGAGAGLSYLWAILQTLARNSAVKQGTIASPTTGIKTETEFYSKGTAGFVQIDLFLMLLAICVLLMFFFSGCGTDGAQTTISLNAEQSQNPQPTPEPELLEDSAESCCTVEPRPNNAPGCVYSLLACGISESGDTNFSTELPSLCQPPYREAYPRGCEPGISG